MPHPIDLKLTDHFCAGTLDIQSVYKASPIVYTPYLVYQSIDSTIRGVNITFDAEHTKVALDSNGTRDTWVLSESESGDEVMAMGGTQLVTAGAATSGGDVIIAAFQETGDDIKVYTRDFYQEGAAWQKANDAA